MVLAADVANLSFLSAVSNIAGQQAATVASKMPAEAVVLAHPVNQPAVLHAALQQLTGRDNSRGIENLLGTLWSLSALRGNPSPADGHGLQKVVDTLNALDEMDRLKVALAATNAHRESTEQYVQTATGFSTAALVEQGSRLLFGVGDVDAVLGRYGADDENAQSEFLRVLDMAVDAERVSLDVGLVGGRKTEQLGIAFERVKRNLQQELFQKAMDGIQGIFREYFSLVGNSYKAKLLFLRAKIEEQLGRSGEAHDDFMESGRYYGKAHLIAHAADAYLWAASSSQSYTETVQDHFNAAQEIFQLMQQGGIYGTDMRHFFRGLIVPQDPSPVDCSFNDSQKLQILAFMQISQAINCRRAENFAQAALLYTDAASNLLQATDYQRAMQFQREAVLALQRMDKESASAKIITAKLELLEEGLHRVAEEHFTQRATVESAGGTAWVG